MEAVILITLLVMCIIIVFILADNSWFKWEKTDDEAYQSDEFNDFGQDEDEIEDQFESLEDEESFETLEVSDSVVEMDKEEKIENEDEPKNKE